MRRRPFEDVASTAIALLAAASQQTFADARSRPPSTGACTHPERWRTRYRRVASRVLDRLGLNVGRHARGHPDLILIRSPHRVAGPMPGTAGTAARSSRLQDFRRSPIRRERATAADSRARCAQWARRRVCHLTPWSVARRRAGLTHRLSQNEGGDQHTAGERFLAAAAEPLRDIVGNRHGHAPPVAIPAGVKTAGGDQRPNRRRLEGALQCPRPCRPGGGPRLRMSRVPPASRYVDEAISAWTRERGHREAMEQLQARGVARGAVLEPQTRGDQPPGATPGSSMLRTARRYQVRPSGLQQPVVVRRRGPFLASTIGKSADDLGMSPNEVEEVPV